jgi:hypothetical protein
MCWRTWRRKPRRDLIFGGPRATAGVVWLTAAAAGTMAILGFYGARLGMPLPLFAGDEGAYLIRAIYPPGMVASNPFVLPLNNGVHLSVIRAAYATGGGFIIVDRLANAAAYLAGLGLLWRASTAGSPRHEQIALGLLALAFPYYRFAFSNLAEGLFVGVLVLLCVATGRWYRSRPIVHAVAAGAIGAALVLVKPHGLASLAALLAVAVLDAAAGGGWRRLPLRVLLFGVTFFGVGNLIQWGAEEPASHPLAFFVSDFYGTTLARAPPPGAGALAALSIGSMISAAAVLAGAPVLIGLADLVGRWRVRRGRFVAEGADLVFLLLVLALGATLVMVTVFAVKVAWTPSETRRLWGRYFEFFAPMIWLAAAPALARPIGWPTRLGCAVAMLAGLSGLLASFQAGVVLFPWDSSALSAFFHPDPVRAPLGSGQALRALAALASLAAAVAIGCKMRPAQAGLALTLALAGFSTWLDHVWMAPIVAQRAALERDVQAIAPRLPPQPAPVALLAPDANDGHLAFLRLHARPLVYLGPPGGQVPPGGLTGMRAVVVSGTEIPPDGPWTRTFQGRDLSLFERPRGP